MTSSWTSRHRELSSYTRKGRANFDERSSSNTHRTANVFERTVRGHLTPKGFPDLWRGVDTLGISQNVATPFLRPPPDGSRLSSNVAVHANLGCGPERRPRREAKRKRQKLIFTRRPAEKAVRHRRSRSRRRVHVPRLS